MAIASTPERGSGRFPRTTPLSLRARLTLAAAATVASVLVVSWLLLGHMFEDHIERLIEDDLQSRFLELAGALTLDDSGRPALTNEPSDPRYQRPVGGAYWRVTENGQTVLQSLSMWDSDFAPEPTMHVSPTGVAVERRGPNGSILYVTEREVTLEGGGATHRVQVAVGLDTAPVERLRKSFDRLAVIALVVIGAVLSLGAWLQSSFGLRPLRGVRDQLTRVRTGAAARMQGAFPREIEPLVDDLNKLLERQNDLVRRARERAGDLAHGLKTPLTILQIEARNAEQRGETQIAASMREQIAAMNAHVERELSRSRMSGASIGGGALTDPRRTVDRLIAIMQRMPRGETIDWRNDLPSGERLRMDPDDFGEICGNLLDNARKHTRTEVQVSIVDLASGPCIAFDDDGPGIAPKDRDLILQRGRRADSSVEGTGLGLSIVGEALAQYGLKLEIAESPLGGLRMAFAARGLSAKDVTDESAAT